MLLYLEFRKNRDNAGPHRDFPRISWRRDDDGRGGLSAWRKIGLVLLVGIHAFLCGCIVEILRATAAEKLRDSQEPIGMVPDFFLRTLSAPGRFPLYPTYLELFGIVFVTYLLCNLLTTEKSPGNFYLRSGLFYGICTTLCVGFAAIFLSALHLAGKREILPDYTVSALGLIIHFLFVFALAVYLVFLVRSRLQKSGTAKVNRSSEFGNKPQ